MDSTQISSIDTKWLKCHFKMQNYFNSRLSTLAKLCTYELIVIWIDVTKYSATFTQQG